MLISPTAISHSPALLVIFGSLSIIILYGLLRGYSVPIIHHEAPTTQPQVELIIPTKPHKAHPPPDLPVYPVEGKPYSFEVPEPQSKDPPKHHDGPDIVKFVPSEMGSGHADQKGSLGVGTESPKNKEKPVDPMKNAPVDRPLEIQRPKEPAQVLNKPLQSKPQKLKTHPIKLLMENAKTVYKQMLEPAAKRGDTFEAARQYRQARGRHPPPGFDSWVRYAEENDALIEENLFDQIYHDLEPFWSLNPKEMRDHSLDWPFIFSIRSGVVRTRNARPVAGQWLELWEGMLKTISSKLPDMDIPINHLDEARTVVPYDQMNEHMANALRTRSTNKPATKEEVVLFYPQLPALSFEEADIPRSELVDDGPWQNEDTFWHMARRACPPGEARDAEHDEKFSTDPFLPSKPLETLAGYVSNWTEAKSVCLQPHLRNIHGTFVKPRFNPVKDKLRPIFSGCKVAGISNEILLPAAKYFSDEDDFALKGEDTPWSEKTNGLLWRGQATGGWHKAGNWKRFHRHRFVAMMNSTFVSRMENQRAQSSGPPRAGGLEIKGAFFGTNPTDPSLSGGASTSPPRNILVPQDNPYFLSALQPSPSTIGRWLEGKTDVGFDHLMCDPWTFSILGPGKECGYMNAFYSAMDRVTMAQMFSNKYLPDIDGNSYSGRYRAFLLSDSLPIKATIWSEWHDSRLVPWKHFVPMDNSFADLWGILEYFWGYGTAAAGQDGGASEEEQFSANGFRRGEDKDGKFARAGHDEEAKKIAEEGRDWARKVLRVEDMRVYVYRLLLEYARIVSDEREKMAFVDDLF